MHKLIAKPTDMLQLIVVIIVPITKPFSFDFFNVCGYPVIDGKNIVAKRIEGYIRIKKLHIVTVHIIP